MKGSRQTVKNQLPVERVSVVVPVLNAASFIKPLIEAILSQVPLTPLEIILIDSLSEDETLSIAQAYPLVKTKAIEDFSHGAARNMGARAAAGDIVVFLSQDAMPLNRSWLANLLLPFHEPEVAAVYSRQIPHSDASPMERFFLARNFPLHPQEKKQRASGEPLNLSDVFFSNVSSAVRRSLLMEFPFDEDLIMSEDQQLSRDLIKAGHRVFYQPASLVRHSHNYSLKQVFRRYFDSAHSLTVIFKDHDVKTSLSIGSSYFLDELFHMLANHPLWLPYYLSYTLAKGGGALAGHHAYLIPPALRKRCSFHSYHWRRTS